LPGGGHRDGSAFVTDNGLLTRLGERIGANRTVMALSVARLGDALGNSILFIIIPLYVARLPAPWLPLPETLRAGILVSVYGFINAASQPFAGAWIDRVGRPKPFIQGGLALMGLATLGFVLTTRFADLFLLRVVQGVGLAATIPAALAILAINSEQRTRGGTMGVYTSARMLGLTLGPLIGGALADTVGFNVAFYAATALIVLAAWLVHIWVADQSIAQEGATPGRSPLFDRSLFSAGIVGSGLAVFAMASAFSMMVPLERQFNSRLNETAFAFGLAFSVLMVSRLLLQVPLGRLSDQWGRKPVIIGGLVLMAPATLLLGETHTTLELIGLRVIQGIGSAGVAAPAFALAADLARAGSTGRQMSITTMGFGLGIATGPLLAGGLAVISFRLPFLVGALLLVAAAWTIHRHVPETVSRPAHADGKAS
jgi:MFS family permease